MAAGSRLATAVAMAVACAQPPWATTVVFFKKIAEKTHTFAMVCTVLKQS
jgi:hypothetical protein